MIDITSKLNDAMLLSPGWTHEKVRHALSTLAALYPESEIDWEEGDEEWGRVVCCGKEKAFVSVRFPFVFVQADDEALRRQISSQLGVIAVAVRDFDDPSISVDPTVLSNFTGSPGSPLTENVSYEAASVNDIWWATV